jgi:hypothetical protein
MRASTPTLDSLARSCKGGGEGVSITSPRDTGEDTNRNPVHPTPRPEFRPHANQMPVFIKLFFSFKPIAGVDYKIGSCLRHDSNASRARKAEYGLVRNSTRTSQRVRSHVLCYPFPALVSFGGVFRLVRVFGGYNAKRRDASASREPGKKGMRRTSNQDCPWP